MALLVGIALLAGVSVLLLQDGAPVGDRPRRWVVALAIAAAIAGALARLAGFDRSLWIDEFGTLWAIEGSFWEAWSRAVAFHGQSPLYYVLLWPVTFAGESEILLRLPSLACGAAIALMVYRTAKALGSAEAGLFAAALAWTTPVLMEASVSARPYALAMLFAAFALHGFALAVVTGAPRYRVLFVASGTALFLTHYVSSLIMLGLGVGYLAFSRLRPQYRWRAFATDVLLQVAAVLLMWPQLGALWGRRAGLDWIGPPDYLLFVTVVAPFLLPIVVRWIQARSLRLAPRFLERAFAFAMAAPVGVLTAVALGGPNLLAPRYLMAATIPASVIAGLSLSRLRTPAASVSAMFAMVLSVAFSALTWQVSGIPTTLQNQDWRQAVQALDAELRGAPGAFVLYRPGFVEQDPALSPSPALLAPLRSPGQAAPKWPIVPLTFAWGSASREPYFRQVIVPAIDSAQVFFLLVSGTTPKTGNYGPLMVQWIDESFPDRFRRRSLGPFAGIDVIRFDRR